MSLTDYRIKLELFLFLADCFLVGIFVASTDLFSVGLESLVPVDY